MYISNDEKLAIESYLVEPEIQIIEGLHEFSFYLKDEDLSIFVREKSSRYIPPKEQWQFGMTNDFKEDITRIDRKIQGKILEAITNLTRRPLQIVGDTIKPLTGKYNGLWRYRIGDYRLIYRPLENKQKIDLLSFKARGSVY